MKHATWVCLVTALAMAGCHAHQTARKSPRSVMALTDDGVALHVVIYPADARRAPAFLLIHRFGASAASWQPFALAAQQEGHPVACLDLRGHGESVRRGDGTLDFRDMPDSQWLAALSDIRAAQKILADEGAPPHLVLCGEGLGANLALAAARRDPTIAGVVAVSPGMIEHGIAAEPEIRALYDRPLLLVTAEGDAYAADSATRLKQGAPGFCELRTYPGAAHGTDLLSAHPAVVGMILGWTENLLSKPQS